MRFTTAQGFLPGLTSSDISSDPITLFGIDMKAIEDPTARRKDLKRLWIGILFSLLFSAYLGLYVWARYSGLFRGEIETWAPFGEKPSNQYEITPIGSHSLIYFPRNPTSPQEMERLQRQLKIQQEFSIRLWWWYSWIAGIEERFRSFSV